MDRRRVEWLHSRVITNGDLKLDRKYISNNPMKTKKRYDRSAITKRAWVLYRQGMLWQEAMTRAWAEAKGQVVKLPFQGGRTPTVVDVESQEAMAGKKGSHHVEFRLLSGHAYHLSWPKAGTHYHHLNVECRNQTIRVA
ncbi:MAG: hypothetical protein AAF485_13750 [Chloroflexota bacterium]